MDSTTQKRAGGLREAQGDLGSPRPRQDLGDLGKLRGNWGDPGRLRRTWRLHDPERGDSGGLRDSTTQRGLRELREAQGDLGRPTGDLGRELRE